MEVLENDCKGVSDNSKPVSFQTTYTLTSNCLLAS